MGRPPIGKVAMTNTERSRRYRAGLATKPHATKPATKSHATKPAEPATKLDPDIASLKARIAELEKERDNRGLKLDYENAALRQEVARLEKLRKAKAEKPPLPPDEIREKQISALKTRVRNLQAQNADLLQVSGTNRQTMGLIAKVLHPDTRKNMTKAELDTALDEACRAFMAWKSDRDRARRSR
jgi:hypothetical protein